jgi:hypothetical protein
MEETQENRQTEESELSRAKQGRSTDANCKQITDVLNPRT